MKKILIFILILTPSLTSVVKSQDLLNHVHTGYQGWFTCKGDQTKLDAWTHWGRGKQKLTPENVTIDFFPDLREYDKDKLYETPLTYKNKKTVKLFSSNDYETIDLHFKWMKEYGIDGVFLQRFLNPLKNKLIKGHRDKVLEHFIIAAKKYDRKFAVMYDLSGYEKSEKKSGNKDFKEFIDKDWTELNKKYKLTSLPTYMREDNRPVLVIWGLGFNRRPQTVRYAQDVLSLFKGENNKPSHNTYLVAGVPSYWRTLSRDSEKKPIWNKLYASFDMLSPWSVGRYRNNEFYSKYVKSVTAPDIKETENLGIDYMPVIFPGFSWGNLKKEGYNTIPRNGGDFLWNQIYQAKKSGAKCVYFAMFDEVDEGTAIFKLAENQRSVPKQGEYVTLDADQQKLPSDWYLRIANEASKIYRGEKKNSEKLPLRK